MLRRTLALATLALCAAMPALAGTRDFTGNVSSVQYVYNSNRMTQFTVAMRNYDGTGALISFTNIAFLAPSGSDIKNTRDLAHALTVFEAAMNNYQRAAFHINTSDSKSCFLGTSGCEQFFSANSNAGLAVTRMTD